MKRSRIFIFIFISWLALPCLQAQEMITLAQYRLRVLDYSQELKQSKEGTLAAIAKTAIAKTGFLPQINLAASGSLDLKNLNLWDAPTGSYHPYTYFTGGSVTQPIWNGGALRSQLKSDKISQKVSEETEMVTLNNIYYKADQVYWSMAANLDLWNVTQQYYQLILNQYDIIKYRFDEGAIAKNDLLMITTRLKEAELGIKKAMTSYLISTHNFNILMGLSPENAIGTTEKISKEIPLPEQIAFDIALEQRPEYRIAKLQVDLSKANRKLALSKFNPQINLQIESGWGTSSPNLGLKPETSVFSNLSFSMILWHWGERRQTNRQYRALINSNRYNLQIVNDQINQEIANAWTEMDQSYEQIRIAKENLSLAQEALDLNTFSYNEGKITIADVLNSQVSWIQAYTNVITSHYSYKVAVAQYQKVTSEALYRTY